MQSQLSNASPVLNQSLFKILFPSAVSRQPSAVSRQPSAISRQLYHALWVSAFALSAFLAPFALSPLFLSNMPKTCQNPLILLKNMHI
jgi:hypothetical protein